MFVCTNCKKNVKEEGNIGTHHRNHCPYCLFSKHLDMKKPGDRESRCKGDMQPIALAYKKDKEIMLVHECKMCKSISTNRISADDNEDSILELFYKSVDSKQKDRLKDIRGDLEILDSADEEEVKKQLFGM